MSTKECFNRAAAVLSLIVVALIVLLATVTTIQIRWTRQLQQQYEDSRQELLWLQSTCLEDSDPDMSFSMIQQAVRKSLERIEADDSDRHKRQIGSSLQQTLTDMMLAKEKELMSNCLSSSKLCIPGQKGDNGTKGDSGIDGLRGAKGDQGDEGPKGVTGPVGSNGTKGDMGFQGIPGVNGTQGPQGLRGLKGDPGIGGKQGPPGKLGPGGSLGDKGDKGIRGPMGPHGIQGAVGPKGEKGNIGVNGTNGEPGLQGLVGPTATPPDSNCACVIRPQIDVFQPNATTKFYPLGSSVRLTCGATTSPNTVITWSGPLDGCLPVTTKGGQLDIANLEPAHVGNYTCIATNPFGTVSKTITIESNTTGALDCDFEDQKLKECFWSNSRTDQLDWYSIAGHTPSSNTGPLSDHTLNNLRGHYVYVETSSGSTGNVAELLSPELGPNNGSCFTFWYNMFGSQMGHLSVESEICNSTAPNNIHLRLSGNQGQDWHMAQIQIPDIQSNHRVVIKGTRGAGIYGDMAIDDMRYFTGICQSSLNRSGAPQQSLRVAANSTIALSCDINGDPPPTYHWEKKNTGCPISSTSEIAQVTKHAAPGDAGIYECTAISAGSSFTTTYNVTYAGPSELKCTFEDGTCGWTQPTTDEFDWLFNQGATPSKDTGPEFDHTLNSTLGHYLFVESSSPRTLGDAAVLTSYLMQGNQPACLELAYHMFGAETGSLRVIIEDACTHTLGSAFATSGDKGNAWQHSSITINPNTVGVTHDYYVLVKAEVGSSYHGDIAIDDLVLKEGACSTNG